jgi:ribosomal protein L30/L7E
MIVPSSAAQIVSMNSANTVHPVIRKTVRLMGLTIRED